MTGVNKFHKRHCSESPRRDCTCRLARLLLPLLLFLSLHLIGTNAWAKDKKLKFELKGHALTLWSILDDTPNTEDTHLGINRLRLDSDLHYGKTLHLKLITDLELFAGKSVRDPLFTAGATPQDGVYWDFDGGEKHGSSLYTRQSLHRLYLTYETEGLRTDIGKQRIAWGVMRHWRPTDLFNPESPLQIQTGERLGVDALRVKVPLGEDNNVEAVFAPSRLPTGNSKAAKVHFIVNDYDMCLLGGQLGTTDVLGFSFDGYVGDGGLRGEVLRVDEEALSPYWMFTVGGDYSFENNVNLTLEYFNNGGHAPILVNPLTAYQGIIRTRNRQFLGFGYSKQVTPLSTFSLFIAHDLEGHSYALSPRYTWDFAQDRELSAGFTHFGGADNGEYGNSPRTFYLQMKLYF